MEVGQKTFFIIVWRATGSIGRTSLEGGRRGVGLGKNNEVVVVKEGRRKQNLPDE